MEACRRRSCRDVVYRHTQDVKCVACATRTRQPVECTRLHAAREYRPAASYNNMISTKRFSVEKGSSPRRPNRCQPRHRGDCRRGHGRNADSELITVAPLGTMAGPASPPKQCSRTLILWSWRLEALHDDEAEWDPPILRLRNTNMGAWQSDLWHVSAVLLCLPYCRRPCRRRDPGK